MIVRLTAEQLAAMDAKAARVRRQHDAGEMLAAPGCGRRLSAFERNVYPFRSELAAAIATGGVCVDAPHVSYAGDILLPGGIPAEVRSTAVPYGSLIVREHDPAGRPYLLVIYYPLAPNVYNVRGWCYGYEARQARYWRDPDRPGSCGAWYKPPSDLARLKDLPR